MKEKYTKEEFNERLGLCTICQNKKMKDMSKEDLKALKKQLAGFEEFKLSQNNVFTNINKLKCDYTTYKEERTKYNMPVEEVCSKCGKSFDAGEEIYTAFEEGKLGSCIICGNCAND